MYAPPAKVRFPPQVPGFDPSLENLDMIWVGDGLNLSNVGWKAILAWTERIVKSEWSKVIREFWMMNKNRAEAALSPIGNKKSRTCKTGLRYPCSCPNPTAGEKALSLAPRRAG
jgi:hypothetical protein